MNRLLFFLLFVCATTYAPVHIVSINDADIPELFASTRKVKITLTDNDDENAMPAYSITSRARKSYTLWIDGETLWYCWQCPFYLLDETDIPVAYQHTITPLLTGLNRRNVYLVVITITPTKLYATIKSPDKAS